MRDGVVSCTADRVVGWEVAVGLAGWWMVSVCTWCLPKTLLSRVGGNIRGDGPSKRTWSSRLLRCRVWLNASCSCSTTCCIIAKASSQNASPSCNSLLAVALLDE